MRKQDWPAVLSAARRRFGQNNAYGVLAFGIGPNITRGREQSRNVLNVYVQQKHPRPNKPISSLKVSRDLTVPVNVIGVGAAPRAHASGAPSMLGLYAGATIRALDSTPEIGAVTCILGDSSGPTHLLTSGHLFAPSSQTEVQGAAPGQPPSVIGELTVNLLDRPYSSMDFPIDAALVELNDKGRQIAAQSSDGPKLVEILDTDFTLAISVTAFLATAHDYSASTTTKSQTVTAWMTSPGRGTYAVHDVVATNAALTQPGDSGTILFNGATTNAYGVGICIGQLGTFSLFEPIDRALGLLRQGTNLPLDLI